MPNFLSQPNTTPGSWLSCGALLVFPEMRMKEASSRQN